MAAGGTGSESTTYVLQTADDTLAGWVFVVPGVQQGSTNFPLSGLQIKYPDAGVLSKGWSA